MHSYSTAYVKFLRSARARGLLYRKKFYSTVDLLLWCAKNDLYIQLWLLGTIKVEKYVKWVVKKLGSRNTTGNTLETYFATLIS